MFVKNFIYRFTEFLQSLFRNEYETSFLPVALRYLQKLSIRIFFKVQKERLITRDDLLTI